MNKGAVIEMLKVNDYVQTPRFGEVRVNEIFSSEQAANESGYTEPTHCIAYTVLGKSTGLNRMVFCVVRIKQA